MSQRDRQTLSDLNFIEHALRTRSAMLTPRHKQLLDESRTLAHLQEELSKAKKGHSTDEHRAAQEAMLTALELRINKLEHREGKASMSYFSAPAIRTWSQKTQVSSVGE